MEDSERKKIELYFIRTAYLTAYVVMGVYNHSSEFVAIFCLTMGGTIYLWSLYVLLRYILKKRERSAIIFFLLFLLNILIFGVGYNAANVFQAGPKSEYEYADFFDCLYFSVVTVTTVGFGDFQPQLWGKLLVIMQVISGPLIIISFVNTSRRLGKTE